MTIQVKIEDVTGVMDECAKLIDIFSPLVVDSATAAYYRSVLINYLISSMERRRDYTCPNPRPKA